MEKLIRINPTHIFLSTFFLALVFLSFPSPSLQVEDEDGGDFSYDPNSELGPGRWGDLEPEWFLCKNGTMQSPINIRDLRVQSTPQLGQLQINYTASNATLRSTGHDIRVDWTEGAGYFQINATRYILYNCHWHSPSEHTINGKRYDLEIHFVHQSEDGKIAVIGVFYSRFKGRPDPFLHSIRDDLMVISENKTEVIALGIVDPNEVMEIDRNSYYTYMGSFTTPPCTQHVVWTIVKKIKTVRREQIRLLRVAVKDESYTNARPVQPLNNRLVQRYPSKYFLHH